MILLTFMLKMQIDKKKRIDTNNYLKRNLKKSLTFYHWLLLSEPVQSAVKVSNFQNVIVLHLLLLLQH